MIRRAPAAAIRRDAEYRCGELRPSDCRRPGDVQVQ